MDEVEAADADLIPVVPSLEVDHVEDAGQHGDLVSSFARIYRSACCDSTLFARCMYVWKYEVEVELR